MSVYEEVDVGCHRTEVSHYLLAIPVGRQFDDAAIAAHVVVADGYWHAVVGNLILFLETLEVVFTVEHVSPSEAYVHIFGVAVAVKFPDARHLHGFPSRVVVVGLVEIGGTLVGIGHPVEFPRSLKREVIGRLCHVAGESSLHVLIGEEVGV